MAVFVYSWVLSLGTQPKYLSYELSRATLKMKYSFWKIGNLHRKTGCVHSPPTPSHIPTLPFSRLRSCLLLSEFSGWRTAFWRGHHLYLVLYSCAFEASPWLLQRSPQVLIKLPVLRSFFWELLPNSTMCPKLRTGTLCTPVVYCRVLPAADLLTRLRG